MWSYIDTRLIVSIRLLARSVLLSSIKLDARNASRRVGVSTPLFSMYISMRALNARFTREDSLCNGTFKLNARVIFTRHFARARDYLPSFFFLFRHTFLISLDRSLGVCVQRSAISTVASGYQKGRHLEAASTTRLRTIHVYHNGITRAEC